MTDADAAVLRAPREGLVGFTIVALRVEVDRDGDDWWVLTLNDCREVHIRRSEKDCGWVWVDPQEH